VNANSPDLNHAMINLPGPVDRVLRLFVVTPDMHRSTIPTRHARDQFNYGFKPCLGGGTAC